MSLCPPALSSLIFIVKVTYLVFFTQLGEPYTRLTGYIGVSVTDLRYVFSLINKNQDSGLNNYNAVVVLCVCPKGQAVLLQILL